MGKIIIHNECSLSDSRALECVKRVVDMGFQSGENQYCWVTSFKHPVFNVNLVVYAMKTKGRTHAFKVRDEVIND